MKIIHTTPCNECPWRKTAAAGWLGGHEVEAFSEPVAQGIMIPCHKKVERAYCAGAAIAMRNSCTVPRDPAMAAEREKVRASTDVFRFTSEFEAYHKRGLFA